MFLIGIASLLPTLLAKIVGFFTIECSLYHGILQAPINLSTNTSNNISNTTDNKKQIPCDYFTKLEIIKLWDKCCQYLYIWITSYTSSITTSIQILQIKEELLLLIELITDELYNFHTIKIYEIIRFLWLKFIDLQVEYVCLCVNNSLSNCLYQSMSINNEITYNELIKAYSLDSIVSLDSNVSHNNNINSPNNINSNNLNDNLLISPKNRKSNLNSSQLLDALEEDLGLSLDSNTNSISNSNNNTNLTTNSNSNDYDNINNNQIVINQSTKQYNLIFSDVIPTIMHEIYI